MMLSEDCRPQAWSDVVGQSKAIKQVAAIRPRGLAGRAWMLQAIETGTMA